MKKILLAVLFSTIAFSQAHAALTINTLNCGGATIKGHLLLGVGYKVQIVSKTSVMSNETKFYLISQVISPSAPVRRTELVFQGEEMNWLKFMASGAVVHITQGWDQATIELANGAKASCK